MILFVCGPSRGGKTSALSELDDLAPDITVLRASKILRTLKRPLHRLNLSQALENQYILGRWLSRAELRNKKIVVDGHLLITTTDGPLLVPDSLMSALPIGGIIFIGDKPEAIFARRSWKSYPKSVDVVRELSRMERLHARRLARMLEVPFVSIADQSKSKLGSRIERMFQRPLRCAARIKDVF